MERHTWQDVPLFTFETAAPSKGDAAELALARHWGSRDDQMERHSAASSQGATSSGSRGEVTGGSHLDPVLSLIRSRVAPGDGFTQHWERGDARCTLPGWFRPAKNWDLVYRVDDAPVAAVELKSLASSFGNNLNNRVEEAVGCAADLDRAVAQGLLATPVWKGFVFVINDNEDSRKPSRSPRAPVVDEAFEGLSYVERAGLLGSRLVESGLYDCVWFVASSREGGHRNLSGSSLEEFGACLQAALRK